VLAINIPPSYLLRTIIERILLGILVFTYAFAMCMVIATTFVYDAWTGHYLVKLFFFNNRYGNVLVDWIFFCFFVLFPLFVMCITLVAQLERWWEITMLFWYSCVSLFFAVFCCNVVFFEIQGAINFLRKRPDMVDQPLVAIIREAILLRQRASYSGYRTRDYLSRSTSLHATDASEDDVQTWNRKETVGWWARITLLPLFSIPHVQDGDDEAVREQQQQQQQRRRCSVPIFSSVNPPQVLFTIDDVQENVPFVTKHTWSLERLFFRPRNSRYVAIVGGPGSLTGHQMKSSLVCSIIGVIMIYFLILAALVWMHAPTLMIAATATVCILISFPLYRDTRRMVRMMQGIFKARSGKKAKKHNTETKRKQDTNDAPGKIWRPQFVRPNSRRDSEIFSRDEANEAVVLVSQQERLTTASNQLCWSSLGVEIFFFFFFPTVVLFQVGNLHLAFLYIVVAGISGIRRYVNILAVVEETGDLGRVSADTPKNRWHKQSRLNVLIKAISYNKSRIFWQWIFLGVGSIWVLLSIAASRTSPESFRTDTFTFVEDFAWKPVADDVRYESCEFTKSSTFGMNATLADYAFLTQLPYKTNNIAEIELAGWFRGVNVTEDLETVIDFQKKMGHKVPVVFRLFRFRQHNGLDRGVISIRGTVGAWDLVSSAHGQSLSVLLSPLVLQRGSRISMRWRHGLSSRSPSLLTVARGQSIVECCHVGPRTARYASDWRNVDPHPRRTH
jgi:hypothetical protein